MWVSSLIEKYRLNSGSMLYIESDDCTATAPIAEAAHAQLESRGFQLLHEVGHPLRLLPFREQLTQWNVQHLGEKHDGFVVYVPQPRLDLRDSAAADVEAGNLPLRGEDGLGPSKHVATPAHLGTDVVLVTHRVVPSLGHSRGAIRRLEAHAWCRVALAEFDELVRFRPCEQRRRFCAKIGNGFEADRGHKQFAEYGAGELFDLLDRFTFTVDLGFERGSRKVYAGNAAVVPLGGPPRTTSFSWKQFDELGFDHFQSFRLFVDLAVKGDGFGDEGLEVSGGHRGAGFQVLISALTPAHLLRCLRDAEVSTPGFFSTRFSAGR